jgi:hypothetical protein
MKTHRHLRLALLSLLAILLGASSGRAQDTRNLEFTLESITVEPAGGDAEFLVRRHCPLRENQTITPDILLDARAEMLGTGLFDRLDIYTARGSRPGVIRAVVTARPSRRFLLESGVGTRPAPKRLRRPPRGAPDRPFSSRRMGSRERAPWPAHLRLLRRP